MMVAIDLICSSDIVSVLTMTLVSQNRCVAYDVPFLLLLYLSWYGSYSRAVLYSLPYGMLLAVTR